MKLAGAERLSGWLPLAAALALLSVANGRWIWPPAAWLAPLAMLVFVDSRPLARGLGPAFLVQLLAFFVGWRGLIPVPGLWYYLVAGIYALAYFLPFVAHRLLASRLGALPATLVLPVSWVAIEFLFQSLATPYGSWASTAYSQVSVKPLLQLVSVTGVQGVHFLIAWSAAVAAAAWRQRRHLTRPKAALATWALVMAAVLAWGQWRIASAPAPTPRLRVAALTPSAELSGELQRALSPPGTRPPSQAPAIETVAEIAERINRDLLERSRLQARAGARVVVWSEHAARVTRDSEARLIAGARDLARAAGVYMILGVGLWDPEARPAFENKTIMIDARGELAGVYHKARPIVGQESGLVGGGESGIAVLETEHGRFGVAICHDLDFPGLVRQAGRAGVDVLFAPSSDWSAITPLHGHMAIPRAVENGCSLVRPCSNGLSLVTDPVGRIVASQLDHGGGALTASVPLARRPTLYPRLGDAFAWADLVALALLVIAAVRRPRRRAPAPASAAPSRS